MRLSQFINDHMETILTEWKSFAATLQPTGTSMSESALLDHGKQILQTIASDMDQPESAAQQSKKSKGLAPNGANASSAASTHGIARHDSGFTMLNLISEYRAMRASVLRLWMPQIKQVTEETSNDMLRFNEAIDQALAESARTFMEHTTRARETFLAILGHDLRSPLAAMSMAGDYLTMAGVGTDSTLDVGERVKRSAATMNQMVNDLLEYARTQLGGKMPIALSQANMKNICQAALHDASAAHPECPFKLDSTGDVTGSFDIVRLQQVVTNLLNNAAQYRGQERPVTVLVQGTPETVTVQVSNFGPAIPQESLQAIFNPMVQLSGQEGQPGRPPTSLGLGLFIAREITETHSGKISVASSEGTGTVFTVEVPREQPAR
jgi:signal transduction histidine kinase